MNLLKLATTKSIPAIAAPAFPKSSQFISAKSLAAEANIFIDAAIAIKLMDVEIIFSGLMTLTSAIKPTTSPRTTPMPAIPLAKPFKSNSAKSLAAEANIFIDAAIAIIAIPSSTKFFLVFELNIPFLDKLKYLLDLSTNLDNADNAPTAIAIIPARPRSPLSI